MDWQIMRLDGRLGAAMVAVERSEISCGRKACPGAGTQAAGSLACNLEGIRSGEVSDVILMRDQPCLRPPMVQEEGGWLHVERRRTIRAQVECHLVGDAWSDL